LNVIIESTKLQSQEATHVITYGTAWVVSKHRSDSIVANCHKVPQKQFAKELLSVDQIQNLLNTLVNSFCNPNCNIISQFHGAIKDGL
jgi:hypothetical protein